jgi:hypothetical protein
VSFGADSQLLSPVRSRRIGLQTVSDPSALYLEKR